jgi:hypothetical protein
MKNMYKYILVMIGFLALAGCEERYRYPCQDPKHHDSAECKKENCEITRTCVNI